jgi:hypothetical protein
MKDKNKTNLLIKIKISTETSSKDKNESNMLKETTTKKSFVSSSRLIIFHGLCP